MSTKNLFDQHGWRNINILKSILKSGDYSAYFILWVKVLQILATPVDMFLAWREKKMKAEDTKPAYPIILVVGPHRSGTTFVSQVLSDSFQYHPLGNLHSIFHRSRYFLFKWLRKRILNKPRLKFRNYYGMAPGIYTIGDCHEVWDQWYGEDHSTIPDTLPEQAYSDMRNFFGLLTKAVDMPVISKNGQNSMIFGEMAKRIPEMIFVVVDREIEYITQSTITADEHFFGDRIPAWGMRKDVRFNPDDYDSVIEAVTRQCMGVQERMQEQIDMTPEDRMIRIDYRDFCADPISHVMEIHRRVEAHAGEKLPQPDVQRIPHRASKGANDSDLLREIRAMVKQITGEEIPVR